MKLNKTAIAGKLNSAGRYLTNTRWAILRSLVESGAALTSPDVICAMYHLGTGSSMVMPEKAVDTIIITELHAAEKLREYKRTKWIKQQTGVYEAYEYEAENKARLYLDRLYVDNLPGVFGESVWAKGIHRPVFSTPVKKLEDFCAMLMPLTQK